MPRPAPAGPAVAGGASVPPWRGTPFARLCDMNKSLPAALAAALLLLATAPASAGRFPNPSAPEARRPAVPWREPEVRHDGGVAYVSGGVTAAGRERTLELGRPMNLQLAFATPPERPDLADVAVRIDNADGQTVLDLAAAGPLLFAQLEPGRYRVVASVGGRPIERSVQVPAQGQRREDFSWR